MTPGVELDYLVIGHVTRDVTADGAFRIGGTASYAARTARALGCRVGVVTSAAPDLDLASVLDGVCVRRVAAPVTTTFENIYRDGVRVQVLHAVAPALQPNMVPPEWRAAIVHLGPVAQECPAALLSRVEGAFLGLTPQGWLRRWDAEGHVGYAEWEGAALFLRRADAVVLSETDVPDERVCAQYARQTRVLVVTRGALGCTVFAQGERRDFPAPRVNEVDPTGAGDVFAAAFFYWLQRRGDPWEAARFANCVAARSVTRVGLAGTPTAEEVSRCRREMHAE